MQHEKGHDGDTNISPLVLHGNGASLLAHFQLKMSIPRMWGYFEPQNAWERTMMNFMHYSFYKWTVFLPLFLWLDITCWMCSRLSKTGQPRVLTLQLAPRPSFTSRNTSTILPSTLNWWSLLLFAWLTIVSGFSVNCKLTHIVSGSAKLIFPNSGNVCPVQVCNSAAAPDIKLHTRENAKTCLVECASLNTRNFLLLTQKCFNTHKIIIQLKNSQFL